MYLPIMITVKEEKKVKRIKIKVNFNNMMKAKLGAKGISEEDISKIRRKIKQAVKNLKQKRDDGKLGFMYLPYDVKTKEEIKKVAELVREKFENLVVLGIGGSALGTIALHRALKHPFHNLLPAEKRKAPRLFVMDNVDPEVAANLFDVIDLKKTLVNVITKSGETAETVAFMKIIWDKLIKQVGKNKLKDHVVITTDREKGTLRQIVNEYGFISFEVPSNVGGRFSVLSSVGLFPLACSGINIDELLKGAAFMDSITTNDNIWKNPAYMRAILHYIADKKFGQKITVMLPYSNALKDVADWFAQLWAESLGKKMSNDGKIINVGLTPVKALGATDQHSQVQLYMEGPYDKVVNFIRVEKFRTDEVMPDNFKDKESFSYLSGYSMADLINIEQKATEIALTQNKRSNMTIILPEISEFTIGQLIYMLEVETAFIGELYNINAFDQPGVEAGKIATYAMMGRKGYADKIKNIKSKDILKYII